MNKKITLWKIILVIILAIALFVGYRVYKFNSLNSNVEVFQTSSNEDANFIGVISNNYYKLEEDRLKGFKYDNTPLFDIELKNVADIIYDKYIYIIQYDGIVRLLDRNTGEEKKSVKLDSTPIKGKYIDKQIIVYCKNSIKILSNKLEIKKEINDLKDPVSFSQSGDKYSLIELTFNDNTISSYFNIFNKEEKIFNLISSDEIFLDAKIFGDNTILLSNRYIYLIKDGTIVQKILLMNMSAVDMKDDRIVVIDNNEVIEFDQNLSELSRKKVGSGIEKIKRLKNSIFMLSKEKAIVYENGNIIDEGVSDWIDWYTRDNEVYIIFKNRIQRVNAY